MKIKTERYFLKLFAHSAIRSWLQLQTKYMFFLFASLYTFLPTSFIQSYILNKSTYHICFISALNWSNRTRIRALVNAQYQQFWTLQSSTGERTKLVTRENKLNFFSANAYINSFNYYIHLWLRKLLSLFLRWGFRL